MGVCVCEELFRMNILFCQQFCRKRLTPKRYVCTKSLQVAIAWNLPFDTSLHSPYPLSINTQEITSCVWVEDDSRTCRRSNRRRCRPSPRRSETSSRPHSSCRCSRTPGPTRVTNKYTHNLYDYNGVGYLLKYS